MERPEGSGEDAVPSPVGGRPLPSRVARAWHGADTDHNTLDLEKRPRAEGHSTRQEDHARAGGK